MNTLTVSDAAILADRSYRQILRHLEKGTLPAVKDEEGRYVIRMDDFERFKKSLPPKPGSRFDVLEKVSNGAIPKELIAYLYSVLDRLDNREEKLLASLWFQHLSTFVTFIKENRPPSHVSKALMEGTCIAIPDCILQKAREELSIFSKWRDEMFSENTKAEGGDQGE